MADLSYIAHLEHGLAGAAGQPKGVRTRRKLQLAAARVLDEKGYHAMRAADVTAAAGMAEGSFYVYFSDKEDVTQSILSDFLGDFFLMQIEAAPQAGRFEMIRDANRRWIALCRANKGLMRCILQVGDDAPDFAHLVQRTNRVWYERVARSARRGRPDSAAEPEAALLTAYLLGAMMDELVRKLVIYPDPEFHRLLAQLEATDDDVADAASLAWVQLLYPGEASTADATGRAGRLMRDWLAQAAPPASRGRSARAKAPRP